MKEKLKEFGIGILVWIFILIAFIAVVVAFTFLSAWSMPGCDWGYNKPNVENGACPFGDR